VNPSDVGCITGFSAHLCDDVVGQVQLLTSCHNPATLNQLASAKSGIKLIVKGERKVLVYPPCASEAPQVYDVTN